MATNILMPALSPTMTEGTLARWLKKEGDTVTAGDVLAEIETDKATMEVEAVDEGVLGKILVADGTAGVLVNAPIAILIEAGEAVPSAAAPAKHPPPPHLPPRTARQNRPRLPRWRTVTTRGSACSPPRSPGASPSKLGWPSTVSTALARTGASSRRTSKPPNPPRPHRSRHPHLKLLPPRRRPSQRLRLARSLSRASTRSFPTPTCARSSPAA